MISDKEKIEMYETFLHRLQATADVCLDVDLVKKLINNACNWSRAHRVGNGELSEGQQQVLVDREFHKLCDL